MKIRSIDTHRLERVRQAMAKANLDALVCRLSENVLLLSGHWPLFGMSFLVFPLEGKSFCIVPSCDKKEAISEFWEAECMSYEFGTLGSADPFNETKALLKEALNGKKWKRVGYEGNFEFVAPPWNVAEPAVPAGMTQAMLAEVFGEKTLVDATGLLISQRARKTNLEVNKLRRANEIACFGLERFRQVVSPGISGVELVAEVERAVMVNGTGYKNAQRVRAFAQVSTGIEETSVGYRPMEISTMRKLKPGDLALLEMAVVVDGFWADRTSACVAGTATAKQNEMFEATKAAKEAVIDKEHAGVTAGEMDEAARAIMRETGFGKEFLHITGHGLGFRYHEPTPIICPESTLVLEAGMVHTVEPGVYSPQFGGLRLEDNIVVRETDVEVLGPFNYKL